MQQLLFLDSWNWNWEREREKERHTHTWWWCGCSNRFLIIVSSRCCFFLITHTDIWPVKWGRRRMTLSAIVAHRRAPFHLAGYSTRDYSIPFATAPLPKNIEKQFFFFLYESFVGIPCLPIFFFVSFLRRKWRSDEQTKKRSKRRKWTQSVARRDSRFLFLHFL